MVCIPAYVLPYITFALGFGRLDWFIDANETYAVLYTITTTVIFLIMFTFLMPPIIEATFKDCNFFNEDNNFRIESYEFSDKGSKFTLDGKEYEFAA